MCALAQNRLSTWRCSEVPMRKLEGKVAFIAGSAKEIGKAIAECFAAEGACVACADIDAEGAGAVAARVEASGGRALAIGCDVTVSTSVAAAVAATVDTFGRLHVVSSNAAAITAPKPLAEMDEAEWRRAMDVNVTGSFLVCKHAIPAMIATGGGSIILMASQMAHVAYPGSSAYCTTKGALLQLAKAIALDYAGQGIRANTLSPGGIATHRQLLRFPDIADRAARVGRAPSDGAARRARRGGASRAVPRLGRLDLHDRCGPAD